MKKLSIILTLALSLFMFTACGSNDSDTSETGADTTSETTTNATEATTDKTEVNSEGGTLVMATEAGFAPYEYTEDGTTIIGVDVDIANEIAKDMGKELEILNMDFDSALVAVQQGKVDFGAAGISITEERKENMDFSIEYAISKIVLVVRKDNETINSADDITADTIIGVQQGNTADYYCQDELPDSTLKQYTKFLQAALDLKNGKIDCIMMDSLPAEQLVAQNPEFKMLEKEVFTDKYAIAVQKGNTELLDKINATLNRLIEEGKIDEFTINHSK